MASAEYQTFTLKSPPLHDPLIGQEIGGFVLTRFVGEGRTAAIYAARDLTLGRQVALKLLPKAAVAADGGRDELQRLTREAKTAASLDHEGIVRIFEVGENEGFVFIAMELLEGSNLRQLINSTPNVDVVRACQIMADVADALSYAHTHGVIHRDLKPANLILTRSGRTKIADFGLALNRSIEVATTAVSRMGTPAYIAPEVVQGAEAGPASDIYSFAATFWHLLTGAPPFAGDPSLDPMQSKITHEVPDLRSLRPDLPEALADAITRCLAADPSKRTESMDAVTHLCRAYSIPSRNTEGHSTAVHGLEDLLDSLQGAKRSRHSWSAMVSRMMVAALLLVMFGAGATGAVYWIEQRQRHLAVVDAVVAAEKFSDASVVAKPEDIRRLVAIPQTIFTPDQQAALSAALDTEADHAVVGIVGRIAPTEDGRAVQVFLHGNMLEPEIPIVIFRSALPALEDALGDRPVESLQGHALLIKGRLTTYNGSPQIQLRSPTQLVLLSDDRPKMSSRAMRYVMEASQ